MLTVTCRPQKNCNDTGNSSRGNNAKSTDEAKIGWENRQPNRNGPFPLDFPLNFCCKQVDEWEKDGNLWEFANGRC